MTAHDDTFDTSPERVHETPDREHVSTQHPATRLARRIARWLTGHHPPTPGHPPPDPYTDIDPYGHVLPPRPRNTP